MTKIFISYSRVDSEVVKQFSELLGYGCDIWYDQAPSGIMGGEDWWQRIISEIDKCEYYIYLLSYDSISSDWCQKELDRAIELKKHIIPVRIRDRTKLPNRISHLHMIDAFGDKLIDDISRIYGSILRKVFGAGYDNIHDIVDLKSLNEIFSYIDSDFVNELYIQGAKFGRFNKVVIDKLGYYLDFRKRPETMLNDKELESLFSKFAQNCELLFTEMAQFQPSKIAPEIFTISDSLDPLDLFVNSFKIEAIEKLSTNILTIYQQIVKFIKLKYPHFKFGK